MKPTDTSSVSPILPGTVFRHSHCEIASSLSSYSITLCSHLQYNKACRLLKDGKTNVKICLFAMEAMERKIFLSDNEWAVSQVMGAPMSWSTSQGQNETFCWAIYVIGGVPNDVVEGQWVSGHHSSPQKDFWIKSNWEYAEITDYHFERPCTQTNRPSVSLDRLGEKHSWLALCVLHNVCVINIGQVCWWCHSLTDWPLLL